MQRIRSCLILLVLLLAAGLPETHAQVSTLNYQGVLADASGNLVPDGEYNFNFRIYDRATGGTTLWGAEGQTLFVGDGLNDLPALASADVSVTTLETVDLVKSKADVLMMSDRLLTLPALIDAGRRFTRVSRQNIVWAVVYNLFAIPLAITGLATPWLAALGMSASSLLVMVNACRLLRN